MSKKNGAIVLFVFLMFFWVILASTITLMSAIIGFLVSLFVVFYNYDLIFNQLEATKVSFKFLKELLILVAVLLFNILKSNIEVAQIVLSKNMKIDPGFVNIRQPLKKELNQALYGNAITLTPGTLTIDMNDEIIIVHGLNKNTVKNLENSTLERAFIALEGKEK